MAWPSLPLESKVHNLAAGTITAPPDRPLSPLPFNTTDEDLFGDIRILARDHDMAIFFLIDEAERRLKRASATAASVPVRVVTQPRRGPYRLVLVVWSLVILTWLILFVELARAAAPELPMLSVPALGLKQPLTRNVDLGPVLYWRDGDTFGIAGHRTTHGAPFRGLDRLRPGTPLWVGGKRYEVVRQVRVRPWDTWILNWRGVVLTACDPPGSDRFRLAVLAKPVSAS